MKVLLVNGSPHQKGCTYTALEEVAKTLEENGIEAEIFQLGNKAINGCIGCGSCKKSGQCFMDDKVNEFTKKAKDADGFIFGTPVHYAGATGAITSFMDRVFYRHGIIVASMYVIKITISDRKHILEKESGFFSIKFAENDSQAASIFLFLFIMDCFIFLNP